MVIRGCGLLLAAILLGLLLQQVAMPLDEARRDDVPLNAVPLDEVPLDEVPFDEARFDEVPFDETRFDEAPLHESEGRDVGGADVARPDPAGTFGGQVLPHAAAAEETLSYPNEPEANTVIASSDMSRPLPWGPAEIPAGTGSWWQWEPGDPETSLHVEPGIPGGPHFNRTRYRAGLKPGHGPVSWGAWNAGSVQQGDPYERIYFSQRLRLVSGVSDGRWESHPVGTKLGFFGVGRCRGASNELYPFIEGGTRSEFTLRMGQQNVASVMMGQNRRGGPVIRVGEWHHSEIEMVLNDLDRPNGVLRWWLDGELIMEYTDLVYRTSEHPCGFLAYKWNPTWGGAGGPEKSRDDFLDISDIRISGVPLN